MAIPAFLSRSFRHSTIYVGNESGIEDAKDLAGKRVGVPEYQMTASVWTRGYLAPLTKPSASGTYKVKKTLKAKIGSWSPVAPASVSYQWYRSGKKIKKATKATYKLTKSDRGKSVKVRVTVSAVGYYTTYAYSASHKVKR